MPSKMPATPRIARAHQLTTIALRIRHHSLITPAWRRGGRYALPRCALAPLGTRPDELLLAVLLRALLGLRAANLDPLRLDLRLSRHLDREQAMVEAGLDVVPLYVRGKHDLALEVAEQHLAADVVALLLALLLFVSCLDAEDAIRECHLDVFRLESGNRRLYLIAVLGLFDVDRQAKGRRLRTARLHAFEQIAEEAVHRVVETGELIHRGPSC